MTDQQDNLSIISTERRVWLLLVDERDDGKDSRVGERIEELAYVLERHSDAHRLMTINERLDEPWQTSGARMVDSDDHWRITFSRPLTAAEWYVAGPGGEVAEVSHATVGRLLAIADTPADEDAERASAHLSGVRLSATSDNGEPSEYQLERQAEQVGLSPWERLQ